MAKWRTVYTEFWRDPKVLEEFTVEDKIFFLYLLTNPLANQIGVYQITRKQMAFEIGYSMESINPLLDRFINHHHMILYDYNTREICIKNWGKYNFTKGGKPVEDCIRKEIREVKNIDFLKIIYEKTENEKIRYIFEEYFNEITTRDTTRDTTRGQKQKQKQKQKEKQQQQVNFSIAEAEELLNKTFLIDKEQFYIVIKHLEKSGNGIDYLKEKIEVVNNTENVKNVIGYLITAIDNDYKPFKQVSQGNNKAKGKTNFSNFGETYNRYSEVDLNTLITASQKGKFGEF